MTLVLIATLFALDRLIPIVNNFINGGGFGFLGLGPVPETQSSRRYLVCDIFGHHGGRDVHRLSRRDAGV